MTALVLGAVAYDPKVVTIWEGFRPWLRGKDVDVDFALYSHYERQVEVASAWRGTRRSRGCGRGEWPRHVEKPCGRSSCGTPTGS